MRTDGSSSETGASGIGEKRRRRMKILGHVLAIGVSAGLPIRRFVTAVGLALAIILRLYRNKSTANVDEADMMKW